MNIMFNNKAIVTKSYTFNQIFQEYSMKNVLSLSQFTIGKYGLKPIESNLLYKTTEHKMFNPNSMILGIGIEEIGFSFSCISGCVSPIYNTYSINLSIAIPKYLKYVFPCVLNSYKYIISKKSTRREYEIDTKALSKIVIQLPDLETQFKIANILEHFEKQITNEQSLLEKLSVTKKSLLTTLFPKYNVTIPKLRFKGYTDAWEQRKLSELVIIERGGSPRPIDKFITNDENGLNWVKIGDAPEQGNYITKTAEKIKPEGLSKTRKVHPGDLILSNSMSFGRPYIMAINGCIHDGWLAIRDTQKRFDLKFLCTLLGSDSMLNQYKAMAAGSTVNNLNKELVGSTTVSFPKMEEQVKIGEYFDNLDHLITLHQRKFDKLKQIKKALLDKMFV